MTHETVQASLSDYLDGQLGDLERQRVERHLAACRVCDAVYRTLKATVDAVHSLPAPAAPARARGSILQRAQAEVTPSSNGHDHEECAASRSGSAQSSSSS
ncbi:MAG: zf-HC2 domain-containing protein [Chloroflexi bacterium]|nr:zf-HC2 domain-containing protein [Chloroflexota bacterium]